MTGLGTWETEVESEDSFEVAFRRETFPLSFGVVDDVAPTPVGVDRKSSQTPDALELPPTDPFSSRTEVELASPLPRAADVEPKISLRSLVPSCSFDIPPCPDPGPGDGAYIPLAI